jgi:hypothetical protein
MLPNEELCIQGLVATNSTFFQAAIAANFRVTLGQCQLIQNV